MCREACWFRKLVQSSHRLFSIPSSQSRRVSARMRNLFENFHMKLCTCERVAENGDLEGCFLHAFHRTPSCRAILKCKYRTTSATLSRTVLRLILPIPYCKPAQKLVANAERSCAVNVKSCSSGGTAWRRKIFRNSRVNGAPLTLFEFESIVIACMCVGSGAWPIGR